MRILVINYEYPPIGGGGGDASKFLAEGYAKRNHDVIVLTARWNALPSWEKPLEHLAIRRFFSFRKAADHCTPFQMLAFMLLGIPRVIPLVRQFKPDVSHCHFAIPVGPLGLAARIFGNIPYILTFQGGDVPGFVPEQTGKYFKLIMPLAKWVVHKASYAVAVGEGLRQMAVREFNRSDILYIPNGVDTNMFKPLEKKGKSDCVRILFAGRFNPQKAVHRLIRAAQILKQKGVSNFQVEIYGGGPLEQDLRTLARDLQLDDTVHFKGWIEREELTKQFGMADIFSLPSDVEGMPVACLQAMACGMAIVGTKTMGIKEAVQHGENGFLVEKGDIPALADALEKLIKDPALRENMGKKSREIVSQAYSWDAICEKYLALMRKIPGNP